MTPNQEIQEHVGRFVKGITEIIARAALAQVQAALGSALSDDEPPRAKRPRAAAKVAKRVKGAKRTSDVLEKQTEQLLAFVRKNPGQRIEEISTALGISTKDLALPAKKLMSEKRIKTSGQKRATRYSIR